MALRRDLLRKHKKERSSRDENGEMAVGSDEEGYKVRNKRTRGTAKVSRVGKKMQEKRPQ